MGKIFRLDADLTNQIAAGEVVERPSSVVKELVENALDAGATKVTIEIETGGLTLIRVTDDGEGMSEEDAVLALERHATSKIRKFEDLSALGTFGFRGEALPSIASVSKLELSTRLRGVEEGTKVTLSGGGAPKVSPVGRAEGTTITVADLFFNVPARRKFMKSTATESAHVTEAVTLAALSRPDVSFTLLRDGKVAREMLRAASRKERAEQIMSDLRLVEASTQRGPLGLQAYLAPPDKARAGAVALHVFVNARPVKDRALARSVAQAYGSVLDAGRFPVGAVYIDLPPEMVDVNVHPQKSEVRFTDARTVFDTVTRELFAHLSRAFAIPALGPTSRPWLPPPRSTISQAVMTPTPAAVRDPPYDVTFHEPVPLADSAADTSDPIAPPDSEIPSTAPPSALGESLFERSGFYASLRFLAQVKETYLLCEGEDGLYVIDQHAADERRNFDRLRKGYDARHVAVQKLLVPEIVELSPEQVTTLTEVEGDAAAFGLELRAVSGTAVAVHGVPQLLIKAPPARLVHDLLGELGRHTGRAFSGAKDLILATMACHGSIRAGDVLSPEQAQALLGALDAIDFAGYCPHGRPVVTRIAFSDLDRRVGR